MGIQSASTLQGRAGKVLFRILLASLLIIALALVIILVLASRLESSVAAVLPGLLPVLLPAILLAVLVAILLARCLSGVLAALMIAPLVEPLAALENNLRSLALEDSVPVNKNDINIDTELEEVKSLVEATSALMDRIRYMGMHDPLTGIYNRAFFEREMQRLSEAGEDTVGFIMGDLDNLKITNDTLGHKAGDFLLRSAAMILQNAVREEDLLARIGGDEFVIIVQDCREEDLELIIGRINDRIKAFNDGNGKVQLGISLGYAYGHLDEHELSDILKEADTQMYLDKGTVIQGVLPLNHQPIRAGRRGSRKRDANQGPATESDILNSLHLF